MVRPRCLGPRLRPMARVAMMGCTMASGAGESARGPVRSFRDLEIYQRAIANIAALRGVLESLPAEERFGLAQQLRRAAVSVAANIAEGYSMQRSARHFRAYLERALGSCNEVLALLDAAEALGYIGQDRRKQVAEAYELLARQIHRTAQVWQ